MDILVGFEGRISFHTSCCISISLANVREFVLSRTVLPSRGVNLGFHILSDLFRKTKPACDSSRHIYMCIRQADMYTNGKISNSSIQALFPVGCEGRREI